MSSANGVKLSLFTSNASTNVHTLIVVSRKASRTQKSLPLVTDLTTCLVRSLSTSTKMEKLIWDIIASVFDTNTSKHLAAQVHDGQGHEALHQIVVKGHIAMVEEPLKLVCHQPTQDKLSSFECFNKHSHCLVLQTHIETKTVPSTTQSNIITLSLVANAVTLLRTKCIQNAMVCLHTSMNLKLIHFLSP